MRSTARIAWATVLPLVLSAWASAQTQPQPGSLDGGVTQQCAVSGRVTLTRDGELVEGARVVVYLELGRHENDAMPRHTPVTHRVLQVGRQFSPQFLVAVKGDVVEFTNQDKERHSVFSISHRNTFDLPPSLRGMTGVHRFEQVEWVKLQCNLHGSMHADVVVVPNAWHTSVSADGTFTLPPIASGTYRLVAVEANGGVVKDVVDACKGPVALELVEGRAERPRRKNGDVYQEYEP